MASLMCGLVEKQAIICKECARNFFCFRSNVYANPSTMMGSRKQCLS